ncbi:MAG: hypothetical protein JNN15_05075 [Blastocatellia bacterium]|nr:hypothetical protein [Blastocatellia bacterium]
MKRYFLALFVTLLFLQGCSNSKQNAPVQKPPMEITKTPITEELGKPGKPAKDSRTVEKLYGYLKSKGWKLQELKATRIRLFNSEESANIRDDKNVGYLILRYENAEKAGENFAKVNSTYTENLGRAFISENFIVAVFGSIGGINRVNVTTLSEQEYKQFQADFIDFFKTN